tara:strand:+ start:5661 stop:6740 length:1080 start_codon:yes stop_codon:yes gene_type:complete
VAAFSSYSIDQLHQEAIQLLSQLIEIPSLSREEDKTADLLQAFFEKQGVSVNRQGNNVWARNLHFDSSKPTILLNSHHDTVKPNQGYTKNPHKAIIEDGKLFGLGSNDAGGPLVCLIMSFLHLYDREDLKYNLLMAATAEEEVSGAGGVSSILSELGAIEVGIVGEPTLMEMAISEKGLMVLDCYAKGRAGHAARDEGENAIYKAIKDIEWFRTYQFPKQSEKLGPVKMSVTVIEAGSQHNVVPDTCHFVVDVRTTDAYTNEETLAHIREHVSCEVKERSTRLQPSRIDKEHAVVQAAESLGIRTFGSPTMSDQALMPFSTVKMGPGYSNRSHTADEFIFVDELKQGVEGYLKVLEKLI